MRRDLFRSFIRLGAFESLRFRLRELLVAGEDGTQPIEFLLIVTFVVVPCFWAILLLQDVLSETLGLETVLLTSPFF